MTASEIESGGRGSKGYLDENDAAEINAAYDKLVKSSHKLAEIMYQQASKQAVKAARRGAAGFRAAAGGSSSGGDEVIDADFVDVDDKKYKLW